MAGDKNPSRALSTFTHKAAYLNLLSKKLKELLDIKATLYFKLFAWDYISRIAACRVWWYREYIDKGVFILWLAKM